MQLYTALLRRWWESEFALANAKIGLIEAEATECPLRIREWRTAVMWLEWTVGTPSSDPLTVTIAELMECVS